MCVFKKFLCASLYVVMLVCYSRIYAEVFLSIRLLWLKCLKWLGSLPVSLDTEMIVGAASSVLVDSGQGGSCMCGQSCW